MKSPLRRVLLLRHGVTEWNLEGRWQGRCDVPLAAQGLLQAEEAASLLVRDATICMVAYSTLRRAAQTAVVVKGAFDLAGRPPVMLARQELVEIDVGQWSGLTKAEVQQRWPHEMERVGRDRDLRYGASGETLTDVGRRVRRSLEELLTTVDAGQTLLVVSHGAAISAVTCELLGSPAKDLPSVLGSLRNGHWVELVEVGGQWRMERWNAGA